MLDEKIIERIDELINMGDDVLSTKAYAEYDHDGVSDDIFEQWRIESLSFLKRVFREDDLHFTEFNKQCKISYHSQAVLGQSILKAAKTDIEGGYLKRLEMLVSADVFSDFLEMSGHLLEQGYKAPAASLVGAVLEDGLRKITVGNNITLKSKEDINSLNQKRSDVKVYSRLTQKNIQVWNDIRNNSDHGNFDEFKEDDVKNMLKGVQDFLEEYL